MKGLGNGFDDQAGFVNSLRSNVANAHAFNRLTHYGARGALLENLTIFFGPERTWGYDQFGFNPGLEGDEHWRCARERALVPPVRTVLDVDPGDPYAAGRRAR